jgi:hypothetical protein
VMPQVLLKRASLVEMQCTFRTMGCIPCHSSSGLNRSNHIGWFYCQCTIETLWVHFDLPAAVTKLGAQAGTLALATVTVLRDLLNWSRCRLRCRVTSSPASIAAIAAIVLSGAASAVLGATITERATFTGEAKIRAATSGTTDAWSGTLRDLNSSQGCEQPGGEGGHY